MCSLCRLIQIVIKFTKLLKLFSSNMTSQCCMLCAGERALRQILDDALKIADRCAHPADRDGIVKAVSDIQSMADALAELRAQGKVGKTTHCCKAIPDLLSWNNVINRLL